MRGGGAEEENTKQSKRNGAGVNSSHFAKGQYRLRTNPVNYLSRFQYDALLFIKILLGLCLTCSIFFLQINQFNLVNIFWTPFNAYISPLARTKCTQTTSNEIINFLNRTI